MFVGQGYQKRGSAIYPIMEFDHDAWLNGGEYATSNVNRAIPKDEGVCVWLEMGRMGIGEAYLLLEARTAPLCPT